MTDQADLPLADDTLDVEGHSVPRMMGMGQLTRPGGRAATGARSAGEPAEADLPPITRRFPRMRDGEARTPPR